MSPIHVATLNTPIGTLGIQLIDNTITAIRFLPADTKSIAPTHPLVVNACQQLMAYFDNPTQTFTLPLNLTGTPFQQRVWRALGEIPPGKTLRYGELAERLQTSPRAIGAACRSNRLPIIIPCHRITARHHLGGYIGTRGLAIKAWLLRHEEAIHD